MASSSGFSSSRGLAVLVVVAVSLHALCWHVAADSSTTTAGQAGDAAPTAAAAVGPYDLDSIPDLQTLLWRHQQYQIEALSGSGPVTASGLWVGSNTLVGLGNRVPAIITGFVLALFTKRLFLLQSSIHDYVDLPFHGNWLLLEKRFPGAKQCTVPWQRLADDDLTLCDKAELEKLGAPPDVYRYSSINYDLPLLQINPALSKYFDKFFPDGEVAQHILQYLFRPNHMLTQELQRFGQDAKQCVIGMHIRTRKYGGVRVKQFTSIARMLGRGEEGTVFVASDASLFHYVQRGLPGRHVWWNDHTAASLKSAALTRGNNPGTELSAVLDMMLLSRCRHIILTPASSLGAVAAALGGVKPVYANFGKHTDPFVNPWFWQSVTTEPCFFRASAMHLSTDELATRFRDQHPLYLYHNQCHYRDGTREVPQYLKLRTNDTSYIQSLIHRRRHQ